mgnify:CR=1 FL=1|tara:strand:- start:9274 stop:9591 length:318 start_codon:yes stop_codon:yes gene_type:complete
MSFTIEKDEFLIKIGNTEFHTFVSCDVDADYIVGKGGDGRYIPCDPDSLNVTGFNCQITIYSPYSETEHKIDLEGLEWFDCFLDEHSEEVMTAAREAEQASLEDS